jgi:hypothetical protein
VSKITLIAPGGPIGPAERAGMKPRNRVMNWLSRNAPALNAVPLTAMAWSLAAPAKRERALQCEMARTPDAGQAGCA